LRCSDQKVSNSFWDSVPDISDSNLKISIDSSSDLFHKKIGALAQVVLRGRSLILWLSYLRTLDCIWIWLLRLWFSLRDYVSPILKIFTIIG